MADSDPWRNDYGVKMALALFKTSRDPATLLWELHQSGCSVKKDRIAALYGLLPRAAQLSLDYRQPYHSIYMRHAAALVNDSLSQHSLILHPLHFGALRMPVETRFPSWIPDWSQERRERRHLLLSPEAPNPGIEALGVSGGAEAYQRWRCLAGYPEKPGRVRECFPGELNIWKRWLKTRPLESPFATNERLVWNTRRSIAPCTFLYGGRIIPTITC
ncbi:hypothetical protein BU26DRAFT_499022 [Trematosphaeria pertusa]|uniref:Uncharacterized protein n=1 Tax=Trematosphaeria pertusa TaxID=390896 RepID=A0A6A6J1R7_9PLEO|nr:uncharacterized protein BU26DRAFT_499022 [Trematosphaeria pertusa]KAF2256341.1 hypothetical protein BU26DRAFT_499022 [Trematosphaeria pertusa]